jgi:type I restriction enzyme R subunit
LQQAKEYAVILGLKFAYSTNGHSIIEFDFLTGKEKEIQEFPSPDDLWTRLSKSQAINEDVSKKLLTPYDIQSGKIPRYYQDIAINKSV